MAIYNKATRTAKGRAYDASVNNGEFSAQYAFMYLSDHDYTAVDVDVLTELEGVVIQAGVSEVKKNSDVSVSIYAPYTNAGRVTPFELRTIGLMAMHPADGLILHSIVTASVPDTVPEDDGANLVDETFQFTLEEVNADNTLLKGDPSGLITVNTFNRFTTNNTTILGTKATIEPPRQVMLKMASGLAQNTMWYQIDQFNNVILSGAVSSEGLGYLKSGQIITTLPDEAIPILPGTIPRLEPPTNYFPYNGGFLSGSIRVDIYGNVSISATTPIPTNTIYFGSISSVCYIGKGGNK